jgi:Glycosyl transferase family 11
MDVVMIFNGLGNQMSQYAFYLQKKQISESTRYIFSKKSNNIHNGYELHNVFGIKYHDSFTNKILYGIFNIVSYKKYAFISKSVTAISNLFGIEVINENDDYNFKPQYLVPARKGIKFYVGGWHSEKYFINVKHVVLNTFQFSLEGIGKENLEVLELIKASNSVSVHVRRGDFLDSNNFNKLGAVCTLNYFIKAIEKMRTLVDNPKFFFFTNDHSWVNENFDGPDYSVIDINTKINSWKDMFLISNCPNQIDSNGSFSWWSSWLNKNGNPVVIVPRNFLSGRHFEDMYPSNWIQLSDY